MNRIKNTPVTKVGALAVLVLLVVLGRSSAKVNDTVKKRLNQLHQRVVELESLLQHFSRDGNDIYVTGANLHVLNGDGEDAEGFRPPNGLGNVIIGYNEADQDEVRTGSHMLVVGTRHSYTGKGGIVAGYNNTTSETYASVYGGAGNTASGRYSAVVGGASNTSSGAWSMVGGGLDNEASQANDSVVGGRGNTASGSVSTVSGGHSNTASGHYASVGGGRNNTAGGDYSSVSGGNGTSTTTEDDHPDTHGG